MTMWECFGEVVKCISSMLLQNCQLISEEMQNTNKPALFARSMLYCSASFREAAAPTTACNIPAASFREMAAGPRASWIREKSHVAYEGDMNQTTGNTVWHFGGQQSALSKGWMQASSIVATPPESLSGAHTLALPSQAPPAWTPLPLAAS